MLTPINELINVPRPFVQATTLMSGSSYPATGMLYPLLYKLLHITLAIKEEDSTHIKKVKQAIYEDLVSRYNDDNLQLVLKKSSYLDPRFKDLNPFIPVEECENVVEAVKIDLFDILNENLPTDCEATEVCEATGPTNDLPSDPPKKKQKLASVLFSDFMASKDSSLTPNSSLEIVLSEVRRYMYNDEDMLEYDGDPMEWWSIHKSHYPTLCKLVRKLWCVPATSVRSEELFSTAGNVLTDKRSRLLPDNLDKLVFLSNNL
uniref:HAT C-terminal dimerisation domain-containing protein n=1 Tax=Amphimedon queenslandica TaxID=400682 RepID=A0A1X7VX41_AMPQE